MQPFPPQFTQVPSILQSLSRNVSRDLPGRLHHLHDSCNLGRSRQSCGGPAAHSAMETPTPDSTTESPAGSTSGLPDQIHDAFDVSKFEDRDVNFLPKGSIETLISRENMESIIKIMGEQAVEETGSLMQYILNTARKVFAIAVHSGIQGKPLMMAMDMLKRDGISDESLPLQKERLHQLQHQEFPAGTDDSDTVTDPGGEQIWGNARIGLFCDNQWKFLAPVFSLEEANHDFHQRAILPFIDKVEISSGQGSYGKVFKCKIHHLHMTGRPHSVRLSQLWRGH